MAIEREVWGAIDGTPVHRYTLRGPGGITLRLTDYGATATELHVPNARGETADIVLGFDRLDDYLATPTYFGATVGRYGNRIRGGRFTLDGETHQLACNEGANHLHGGHKGFDKRIWTAVADDDGQGLRFLLHSPHGEEGYPGALMVVSTYRLTDDGRLMIEMTASSDRPTVLNLVHHGYFNLAGQGAGNVLDQEIRIDSDVYAPCGDDLVVTGEMLSVADTPFDFREPKPIGRDIAAVPGGRGYDHNFALRGQAGWMRPVVTARDPVSGRGFELSTTEPGVQFYTGGYLDETVVGKGGRPYERYAGFTLETQKFPDSPNLSHFPSARLEPGQLYRHAMAFRFFG